MTMGVYSRRARWLLPLMLAGAAFLGACAGPLPTDLSELPPGVEVQLLSDSSGPHARVEFTGMVGAMAPEAWTVGGQVVGITPETEILGTIAVGDSVKVEALVGTDGVLLAREIRPVSRAEERPEPDKDLFEFTGTIEAMDATSWTVSGQAVAVNSDTEIKGAFAVGAEVKVHALVGADGSLTATEISPAAGPDPDDVREGEMKFAGLVAEIGAEAWTIGGQIVAVDAFTRIDAGIIVGDLVQVHAFLAEDGTLTASKIELEDEDDDDDMGEAGMRFELRGTVEAIGAGSWTVSGQVLLVISTTEIDEGIVVGSQVKVEGFVGQDGSFTALEIKSGFDDHGEDEDDDATDDTEFRLRGTVESIGEASWTIGGLAFLVTADTEIDDEIAVGSSVNVEAFVNPDGTLTAHEIELEDESEFTDGDDDDDSRFGSERDPDHDDDEGDGEHDNDGHDGGEDD
jgi:primosomal replication protein N